MFSPRAIYAYIVLGIPLYMIGRVVDFLNWVGWPLLITGILVIIGLSMMARAMYRDFAAWLKEYESGNVETPPAPVSQPQQQPTSPLTEEEISQMDPVNQRFIRAWQQKLKEKPT